jgi:putative acetyltransferase
MIVIRSERREDLKAIHEVNRLAFGQEDEALLVRRIRDSSHFIPELSLVASKDGQIVGHILFSLVDIESQHGNRPILSLAPMAVHPDLQNQGIGSKLVREGLKKCYQLGYAIVIVIGHPDYYPRFGFIPARQKGLKTPFPVSDEAFMVLEVVPNALEGLKGTVKYPPEFDGMT